MMKSETSKVALEPLVLNKPGALVWLIVLNTTNGESILLGEVVSVNLAVRAEHSPAVGT